MNLETILNKKLINSFYSLTGNIGLFGGSFDPIHYGHIQAALHLKEKLNLTSCIFIPAHLNPLKNNPPIASDSDRLNMTALALTPYKNFFVSDIEIKNIQPDQATYTVETLEKINLEKHPQAKIFFLIGSDIIPSLNKWKDHKRLFELAEITPYSRGGYTLDSTIQEFNFSQTIQIPEFELSSTQIRQLIQTNSATTNLIPEPVLNYIKEHRLYS